MAFRDEYDKFDLIEKSWFHAKISPHSMAETLIGFYFNLTTQMKVEAVMKAATRSLISD